MFPGRSESQDVAVLRPLHATPWRSAGDMLSGNRRRRTGLRGGGKTFALAQQVSDSSAAFGFRLRSAWPPSGLGNLKSAVQGMREKTNRCGAVKPEMVERRQPRREPPEGRANQDESLSRSSLFFEQRLRVNAFHACRAGKPLHTPYQVRGMFFRL